MPYTKQILLNNAWTAWRDAIRYSKVLLSGRATLYNRKNFVSSLHNAVELFLKQIMLNQNDHRVADIRVTNANSREKDKRCDLAKKFYNSENLNEFFGGLENKEREAFYSIDYSRFATIHKELLKDYLDEGMTFTEELKGLGKLRNSETHFYVDESSYLNGDEFKKLYNFMIDFFKVLRNLGLVPFKKRRFGRDASIYIGNPEYEGLYFVRSKLTDFSYKKMLTKAPTVQLITKYADGEVFDCDNPYWMTPYCIADGVFDIIPERELLQKRVTFDEIEDYVKSMMEMGALEVLELGYMKSSGEQEADEEKRIENRPSQEEVQSYKLVVKRAI